MLMHQAQTVLQTESTFTGKHKIYYEYMIILSQKHFL